MTTIPVGLVLSFYNVRRCTMIPRSPSSTDELLASRDTNEFRSPRVTPSYNTIYQTLKMETLTIPDVHPVADSCPIPADDVPNILPHLSFLKVIRQSPDKHEISSSRFPPSTPTSETSLGFVSQKNSAPPLYNDSQATAINNSQQSTRIASIIGSVLGSVAFLGLIGLLLRILRRRRAKSQLSISFTAQKSEALHHGPIISLIPKRKSQRWGFEFHYLRKLGAKLGPRSLGIKNSSNRWRQRRKNSQFFSGRIAQPSRDSSLMSNHTASPTLADKTEGWLTRVSEKIGIVPKLSCHKCGDAVDPYSGFEKQTYMGNRFDFPHPVGNDQKPQTDVERGHASSRTNKNSITEIPGLDDYFCSSSIESRTHNIYVPNRIENIHTFDPFCAIPRPLPTTQKTNNYIADIRRSRGQSLESSYQLHDQIGNNSPGGVSCHYPSTIAPIRDSYRDSICSSVSSTINERRYKGRSDPFDLDRPEFWLPQNKDDPPKSLQSHRRLSSLKNTTEIYPSEQLRSKNDELTGKAHPDELLFMEWGDPGPDVGFASSDFIRQAESSRPQLYPLNRRI